MAKWSQPMGNKIVMCGDDIKEAFKSTIHKVHLIINNKKQRVTRASFSDVKSILARRDDKVFTIKKKDVRFRDVKR